MLTTSFVYTQSPSQSSRKKKIIKMAIKYNMNHKLKKNGQILNEWLLKERTSTEIQVNGKWTEKGKQTKLPAVAFSLTKWQMDKQIFIKYEKKKKT